jgi:hypothetical protein
VESGARDASRGNRLDHAAMESWFSTLEVDLGERFDSCAARPRSDCSSTSMPLRPAEAG